MLTQACLVACLAGPTALAKDANTPSKHSVDEAQLAARGAQIYKETCQSCHGKTGQGIEGQYERALAGDLSLGSLTKLISRTMPEEDADACIGEDAAAVATYIHNAFYSEAARVRNRPPRIAMSRLTGEQLRQSIADLYGHFTKPPETSDQRGVKATYYNGTSRKSEELQIDRVDKVIDFDFGTESPGDGIAPQSYLIHWEGSLKVDKTGRYQIVLRSTCSCMMEFGSRNRELINNHVQSEGRDEFKRDIFLTAGRAYPFEISFLQRKRKTKQPPARVSLSWIPPGGIEEVIPQQNLIPEQLADTFALQAKLPPDDRSYGYDRGTAVGRQWDESTTATAIEFAEIAIEELYPKYRHRYRAEADENRSVLKRFLAEVVTVAFRGKLDAPTRKLYIDQQIERVEDDGEAIRRVMLLALKSPRFLYPTLDTEHSRSQRTANRLALVMHDSLPSAPWLVNAAAKDKLQNDSQLTNAARRMVDDYRTHAKTLTFLNDWLGLQNTDEIAKDSQRTANRLALVMHDSLPSAPWLVNAAAKDKLQNDSQLTNAARRMVDDYRTHAKTLTFLNDWLGLQNTDEIAKDTEQFPGFDPNTIQDLKKSMNRFLLDFIESDTSDFRELLQADWRYTTKRLENYYGSAWRSDMPEGQLDTPKPRATQETETQETADTKKNQSIRHAATQIESIMSRSIQDREIHAGVLSHPLIMSNLAYHRTTSPIHRGVFLTRRTLGRVLRPPDASFTPLSAELHPDLTTRERVQLQTGEINCQACHEQINSLGFAFEHFDATGRFRRKEKTKQINAAGSYTDRNGKRVAFNGARELADYLAQSEDCHHAFVEAAFEHFVKQPITAYGSGTADKITKSFQDSGYNIHELLISIAVTASRQPTAATTTTLRPQP